MLEILGVLAGWWAYATRGPVLLQIIVVFGPSLVLFMACKALPQSRRCQHPMVIGACITFIGILGIAIAGEPTGLAIFLGLVLSLWILIDLLRQWLRTKVNTSLLSKADTEIIRPALLITTAFILISKVSNINQIAVISLFSWFGSVLTIGQIVTALLALYLFVVGSLPASILLSYCLGKLLILNGSSQRALGLIIRYAIVGGGIVWALDFTGFNRTAILAIAGGLSVGLGFGVKEVFANFISGIWLLLEGSVRPGEVLYIEDDACEVRKLGLRAALLWRERDNTELLIPNQIFLTTTTTTFTCSDGMRRCQVEVSAAYKHTPISVMPLLVQAAADVEKVLPDPVPVALIVNYGDSAIQYAVRFWIADPMKGTAISSEVRLSIWHYFQMNYIEIPYPQLVLHQEAASNWREGLQHEDPQDLPSG